MKSYVVTFSLILAGCGSGSTSDDSKLASEDRSPMSRNYLANAEFDKTIDNWRPGWPTQWSGVYGAGSPGSAKVIASSTSSSKGRAAFSQCVNLAGKKRFNAGISYSIDNRFSPIGGGRFRVTWFDGKGCFGKATISKTDAIVDGTADPGWRNLMMTNLEAPESAQSAVITAIQSVSRAGEFIVYWDDAYFVALE